MKIVCEGAGRILLCVGLFGWILGACGNLTAGGFGDTTILMTADGDAEGTSAAASQKSYAMGPAETRATAERSELPPLAQLLPEELEGTVSVRVQVYLRDSEGFWSEITAGERQVSLPLSGASEEEVVSRSIREGLYSEIRVVFNAVEVDVEGGLVIDGLPILGIVRVQNTPAIQVERDLGLFVDEREEMEVVIHLNATEWLVTASALDQEVTSEEFEGRVTVEARTRP